MFKDSCRSIHVNFDEHGNDVFTERFANLQSNQLLDDLEEENYLGVLMA